MVVWSHPRLRGVYRAHEARRSELPAMRTTPPDAAKAVRSTAVPTKSKSSKVDAATPESTATAGQSFRRTTPHQWVLRGLTVAAILVSVPSPAASASANVVRTEAYQVSPQSVEVSSLSKISTVTRDDYGVEYYSVVQRPVAEGTVISSPFGYREAPCATCSTFHGGVDYLAKPGSKIAAIANGRVVEVGNPSGNRGVYVIIKHNIDGVTWYSSYSHMMIGSMPFSVGDKVKRGATVGRVGSTGQSTGAHLFFQIKDSNQHSVNPVPWLDAHVNI
jgi:murein DD-endopeptidase MepM/ murein hydrolase activator NlpD